MNTKAVSILAVFVLCMASANAYDWSPQSNDELRSDMLTFAAGFADSMDGTRTGRVLKRFVRRQTRKAARDPYAWINASWGMAMWLEARSCVVADDGSDMAELRKNALLLLDYPLHSDNHAENAEPGLVRAFESVSERYRADARERFLKKLDCPAPEAGKLEIMKVYNQGYVVRTSERTIAIDIKWEGDSAGAEEIASEADIFFLSHPHRDHYSNVMMNALADAGKRVVLPCDIVSGREWDKKTVLDGDILKPQAVEGIEMVVLRGMQGNETVPNNGYLLEFDGWRLFLPGENKFDGPEERFTGYTAPDVILVPSWNRLDHYVELMNRMPGYAPSRTVFIPGHENELQHSVIHRESYRELFSRADRLGSRNGSYPVVMLMDIGESVTLSK